MVVTVQITHVACDMDEVLPVCDNTWLQLVLGWLKNSSEHCERQRLEDSHPAVMLLDTGVVLSKDLCPKDDKARQYIKRIPHLSGVGSCCNSHSPRYYLCNEQAEPMLSQPWHQTEWATII